jgi:hypothetical protein
VTKPRADGSLSGQQRQLSGTDSCFLRGLVPPSAGRPIRKDWDGTNTNFTPERYEK